MINTYKIFISYKGTHKEESTLLEQLLKDNNISVVSLDDVTIDNMSDAEFNTLAEDAFAFVLLLSEDTNGITSVEREIAYAVEKEITVLPVMVDNFELSGAVASYLSNVQRIAVYDKSSEKAMQLVASLLLTLIERQKVLSYSLVEFFAKKFLFKAKQLLKACRKKIHNINEKIKQIKSGRRIAFTIQFVVILFMFIYLSVGLVSTNDWTIAEVYTITLPTLIPSFLFAFITSHLVGKLKNKIVITVISILPAAAIICIMLLTGFTISQIIQY